MLIFAYGSNMDPAQMQQRCPGAQKVGNGVLRGYKLCSRAGPTGEDAAWRRWGPVAGQEVWGVVYRLTAVDLASLDSFEGYRADGPAKHNRYNRVAIAVEIDGVPTDMDTYIAVSTENPPPPNAAYLAHIRDGARHHGLPKGYRAFLAGLT